jgi:OOP family OmpA-OmpF porin
MVATDPPIADRHVPMTKLLACASLLTLIAVAGCDAKSKSDTAPGATASAQALVATATGPAAQAAAAANDDLFAFGAGARFVQKPSDADYSFMAYTPYNLIDEADNTDWTGAPSPSPVFVLELAERTELSRIGFDSGGMNNDEKAIKGVKVEVSDTSATSGFTTVLTTDVAKAANGQNFPLATKAIGRWVRLTITSNHGGEYVGFTGFRGYGTQLTHEATIANVSGTYEGASGWGAVHLKQEGSHVTGCYEYRDGVLSGGVEGRLLKVEMLEQVDGGGVDKQLGLFAFAPDGKYTFGLTRKAAEEQSGPGYDAFYSATKISDDIGNCPRIAGWRGQAAKSQLSQQLEQTGRARLDGINFDFNSATIQPSSRPLLDQVAGMLKEHGDWKVTLEGHTDNVGGAAFNKTLSMSRAAAVKTYLAGGGVAAERLAAAGFGFDKPVAPNETQAGRAQNRRVEIVKN